MKISEFEQLAAIVRADLESLDADKLPSGWHDAEVSGRLRFSFADAQESLPRLEGRIAATIDAVCQRCLEPIRLPLEIELKLLFADADGVEGHDGFEIWELDQPTLRPLDLVEEVLIMSLPLAATHEDDSACRGPDEEKPGDVEMVKPFAALRAQMKDDN